jgi:hypothetical protein
MVLCLLWSIEFLQKCHVMVVLSFMMSGVAGRHCSTMCDLQIVRGGHFSLGGTLAKLLREELVDGSLAVPLATLDNEPRPNKDAMMCFSMFY